MTARSTTERIEAWLEAAPQAAPDRLRASIARQVAATPQLRRHRARTISLLIPLAAALALVAVLIWQLVGEPTGDERVPSDGSSEILETWPDQPDWFVDRERLPFCGESSTVASDIPPSATSMDVAGRRCLLEAFRSGRPAEFVSVVEIPDGGPLMAVTRILGPGRIEVVWDLSRQSDGGWIVEDCTGMDDPRVVMERQGMKVSDAWAEVEVFRVDPAGCSMRSEATPTHAATATTPLEPGDRAGLVVGQAAFLANAELERVVRIALPSAEVTDVIDVSQWLDGPEARIVMAPASDSIRVGVGRMVLRVTFEGGLTLFGTAEHDIRGLTTHGDRTWLTAGDQVVGLDGWGRREHAIDLPDAAGIAAGTDAIWAVSDGGALLEIDPDSGDVRSRHDIGPDVGVLAIHDGALYGWPAPDRVVREPVGIFSTDLSLSMVRFDPSTGDTVRHPMGDEGVYDPASLAFTEGEVVAGFADGSLAWLDPVTLEVRSMLEAGLDRTQTLEPMGGAQAVWVVGTGYDSATLYRVEPTR